MIGTVAGGLTGYAVYWVHLATGTGAGRLVPTSLLMGATAGAIGWLGVWGGNRLKLNYSAKLFMISFLLVFSGATNEAREGLGLQGSSVLPSPPDRNPSPPSPLNPSRRKPR